MKMLAKIAAGSSALVLATSQAVAQAAPDAVTGMKEGFTKVTAVQSAATPLLMGVVAVSVGVGLAISWLRKGGRA